jgi:hypothetical protein
MATVRAFHPPDAVASALNWLPKPGIRPFFPANAPVHRLSLPAKAPGSVRSAALIAAEVTVI